MILYEWLRLRKWSGLLAILIIGWVLLSQIWVPTFNDQIGTARDPPGKREILVMYIFAASDPEYIHNLEFFIHEAVFNDRKCDYIIVVQGGKEEQIDSLPKLPGHAKYISHVNECYDWGTFGWLLYSSGLVDPRKYKFYFFINSSVRGPYLPAYAKDKVHWTMPFLNRLKGDVKIVGPTISCEATPLDGPTSQTWRKNPHVQSYAIATDKEGLEILKDDGNVFLCHNNRWGTIYHSELGSAAAIFDAGFTIDCFMTRYQGVDWTDKANWGCNQGHSLAGDHYNSGVNLEPLEVMFVKVKSYILTNGLSSALKAVKYEQWLHFDKIEDPEPGQSPGLSPITSNEYLSDTPRFKIPKVLEAKAHGEQCFDFPYYMTQNPDLGNSGISSTTALWRHFVYFGQFETRPFRYTCGIDYNHWDIKS